MAVAADGVVSVSYRPLTTMDELHVLLLAAVAAHTTDAPSLEQVFSLPASLIAKELLVLEGYGLVQKVGGKWLVTDRGRQVTAVWSSFGKRGTTEVAATGLQWLLGPGEFSVDEMVRDRSEINDAARGFGINDAASAVRYLEDRRSAAERFESFVLDWPRTLGDAKHGVFAEALVFDAVKLAETDDDLSRLEELFIAKVRAVVGRCTPVKVAPYAEGDEKADAAETLKKSGQDVLKRFEEARRNQRKVNQKLAQAKATCEVWLAGAWLTANVGSFRDLFDAEPAAFVFRSTVPLAAPEAPTRPAVARPPRTQPAAEAKQEEGVLRSLFRWLFG